MVVMSVQTNCLNAAISAYEKGGAWVEALELFETMHAKYSLRPNFVTVNSLLLHLIRNIRMNLLEAFTEMPLGRKLYCRGSIEMTMMVF